MARDTWPPKRDSGDSTMLRTGSQAGSGRTALFPRLTNHDSAGIEQGETGPLNVFLRLRCRLGRHDGEVASLPRGIDQPRAQERRLHATAAVIGKRGRATELGQTVDDAEGSAAGPRGVTMRHVTHETGNPDEVLVHTFERFAGVRLVRWRTVEYIGMRESGRDRVDPESGLRGG